MARLGDFEAQVRLAEREKFAAPLLLIHGLWAGPEVWQPFSGFLAHRGWTSYALEVRSAGLTRWEDLLAAVTAAASRLDAPPVVLGYDLGAWVALHLTEVRAAVAIAPAPTGARAREHPLFRGLRAWTSRRLGGAIRPRGRGAAKALGTVAAFAVGETARWADELEALPLPPPASIPRRLVGGAMDPLLAPDALEATARSLGATWKIYDGSGHDLVVAPGWRTVVSDIHRWIVLEAGESLMLLRGDEDLRDD